MDPHVRARELIKRTVCISLRRYDNMKCNWLLKSLLGCVFLQTLDHEFNFGAAVAMAIQDWIVERLQDYHRNMGTDTDIMKARSPF